MANMNRLNKRLIQRTLTRAITPALGNLKSGYSTGSSKAGPKAATLALNFQSPGMPMVLDQDEMNFNANAFNTNVFVMRCVQTIATTISTLPYMAGLDPFNPGDYDPTAPLAQLLGPATPQAPGGPNPTCSARQFWDWTIKQYIVYGRWGWEKQIANIALGRRRTQKAVVGLWPLVAEYLSPIPTDGGTQLFDGYKYQTDRKEIDLKNDQVFYAQRMSLQDPRQPETVLKAARYAVNIASGIDVYMSKLLQNDMVATTMVVTPPFDEAAARRAFRQQFRAKFQGVNAAGGTIFGEAERDEEDTSGNPLIQVERIAQTAVESSMIQLSQQAKIDITIALGVPLSLIGNASQRTYANAESEYKNFWTITILPLISDMQDFVNTLLAPLLGQEVGWFDLSKVAALKPPSLFAPPMVGDAINFGIADAPTVANLLGIPAATASAHSDTDTIDVGEESATSTSISGAGAGTGRSAYGALERVTKAQMLDAYGRYERRKINTFNATEDFVLQRYIEREHIEVRSAIKSSPQATAIVRQIERIDQRRQEGKRKEALVRSAALAERAELLAEEVRKHADHLRDAGQEYEADVLDEFTGRAYGDNMKTHWVGADGKLDDELTPDDVEQIHDLTDPAKSLTTFQGDEDAWYDDNDAALEALTHDAGL
jgi:HK97 family phage portal protein